MGSGFKTSRVLNEVYLYIEKILKRNKREKKIEITEIRTDKEKPH